MPSDNRILNEYELENLRPTALRPYRDRNTNTYVMKDTFVGPIPEGIFINPNDKQIESIEVKRIYSLRGERSINIKSKYGGRSNWQWASLIYNGMRKMNKDYSLYLKKEKGIEINRHFLLVGIPKDMSLQHEKRIRKHVSGIMDETPVDISTIVYLVRLPDNCF